MFDAEIFFVLRSEASDAEAFQYLELMTDVQALARRFAVHASISHSPEFWEAISRTLEASKYTVDGVSMVWLEELKRECDQAPAWKSQH